jgi:uncharacterized protein YjbI with pentapeptide repeats
MFAETNLAKVDFQGTSFKDCLFTGLLDQVLFYRTAFRGERFPPNEMKGVDFRGARFRHVEFRNLDMNDVKWRSMVRKKWLTSYYQFVVDFTSHLKPLLEALSSSM